MTEPPFANSTAIQNPPIFTQHCSTTLYCNNIWIKNWLLYLGWPKSIEILWNIQLNYSIRKVWQKDVFMKIITLLINHSQRLSERHNKTRTVNIRTWLLLVPSMLSDQKNILKPATKQQKILGNYMKILFNFPIHPESPIRAWRVFIGPK